MAIRPQQIHPVPEPLVRALEALRHELDIPDDFPPAVHDAAVVAGQALAKRLCGQRVPLTF